MKTAKKPVIDILDYNVRRDAMLFTIDNKKYLALGVDTNVFHKVQRIMSFSHGKALAWLKEHAHIKRVASVGKRMNSKQVAQELLKIADSLSAKITGNKNKFLRQIRDLKKYSFIAMRTARRDADDFAEENPGEANPYDSDVDFWSDAYNTLGEIA